MNQEIPSYIPHPTNTKGISGDQPPANSASYSPGGTKQKSEAFILPQLKYAYPHNPATYGTTLKPQLSVRRHNRKRSSTIFVQPRQRPQDVGPVDDAPLAPGLLKGATTLAAAQLLSKLLAFSLNQVLIRFLGARDLGAASQLDLLLTTALTLGRDALRLASQRQSVVKHGHINEYTTDGRAVLGTVLGRFQETVNMGWLASTVGGTILLVSGTVLYGYHAWPRSALLVTVIAALIELAIEPCFLLIQLNLQFTQRARAESVANVARVITIAIFLIILHTTPFLGFALGHLCYSLTLAALYLRQNVAVASETGYSLLPTKIWSSQNQISAVFIGEQAWRTSLELGAQQIVKYFLTEGDKLAVGLMTTLEEQGEYALAANYGSLLARLLFLPVEDALRGYFTRVLAKPQQPSTPPLPSTPNSATSTGIMSNQFLSEPNSPSSKQSTLSSLHVSDSDSDRSTSSEHAPVSEDKITVLTRVLRVYTYLGILSAGFGPLVAGYLIGFVVRTSKFGNAAQVLAAYACYIPVMAWNGSLDALVQSVASLHTLRKQGFVLAALAVVFIVLTYLFVNVMGMGAVGLVWAQVVGMSLRITWSLHFATGYFGRGRSWLRDCVPSWWVLSIAAIAVCLAHYSVGPATKALHFLVIASLASTVVLSGLFAERKDIILLLVKLKKRKGEAKLSKTHHVD